MQPQLLSHQRNDVRINKGDEMLIDMGDGKSLSRTQRRQLTCLSMTFPVRIMLQEAATPRLYRLNPILHRIETQAMELMKGLPRCDKRSYLAIRDKVEKTWDREAREGHGAATMVNAILYVAEHCLMHQRKDSPAARRKRSLWERLCGSLFTLYKHLDPDGWPDSNSPAQANGSEIGKALLSD